MSDEKVHLNKSFVNINYFRKITQDNQESKIFPLTFFERENIEGDSNYKYRALAHKIYEDKEFHYKKREDIYNYLKLNASNFSELNF